MPSDSERMTLRQSFDQAANLYQQARPDYPDELFDSLVNIANLKVGDRLLEVGCATGKATLPLVKREFSITCVEPGSALAAVARSNLVGMNAEVTKAWQLLRSGGHLAFWNAGHVFPDDSISSPRTARRIQGRD